jgi:ribosomal protein S20
MKGRSIAMLFKTRRLVAGVAVLVVVSGVGAAYAASAPQPPANPGPRGAVVGAVSSYLGLSTQQLRADLAAGQSLAQIASAQGKTVSGLEQTIESAVKSDLDQAVAAGKISAAQEQTILSKLQSHLDTAVTKAYPGRLLGRGLVWHRLGDLAATYLGLTAAQLKADLKTGQTLAQIATAQGKTASGLEQAITTSVQARLDKAVSAGTITSQQEQHILSRLSARLDTLVNHTFGH